MNFFTNQIKFRKSVFGQTYLGIKEAESRFSGPYVHKRRTSTISAKSHRTVFAHFHNLMQEPTWNRTHTPTEAANVQPKFCFDQMYMAF